MYVTCTDALFVAHSFSHTHMNNHDAFRKNNFWKSMIRWDIVLIPYSCFLHRTC